MTEKPTCVLVPGAWQPPDAFDLLRGLLTQKQYPSYALALPSVGAEPPNKTLEDDVAALRAMLHDLIEGQGKQVVLLLHSYGGIVGSCASEGMGAGQRMEAGKKGGIIMIIYLAAFAIPKGTSLLDRLGGKPLPWMRYENSRVYTDLPPSVAFPDLSPEEQTKWTCRLTHTSAAVFQGKSTYEPWHDIPSMYFVCGADTALLPAVQESIAESMGEHVLFRRNSGSHAAFLGVPAEVLEGIEFAAKEGLQKLKA